MIYMWLKERHSNTVEHGLRLIFYIAKNRTVMQLANSLIGGR